MCNLYCILNYILPPLQLRATTTTTSDSEKGLKGSIVASGDIVCHNLSSLCIMYNGILMSLLLNISTYQSFLDTQRQGQSQTVENNG